MSRIEKKAYNPDMSQEERMDYLINALCEEKPEYQNLKTEKEERRRILRSLMNVRMPKSASLEFLQVQDDFLKQEAALKGIVTLDDIPTIAKQYNALGGDADRISIWQGDITRLGVDGIVNAANAQMLGCFYPCHGCIDNAIHSSAGIELREECFRIMTVQGYEEPTGQAKITKGYNLPCKYILHTVGPIIQGLVTEKDSMLLQSCYESCLKMAEENKLQSIAFCCISTGEFRFPNDTAAQIAVRTVKEYLKNSSLKRVIFNVFKDCDLKEYIANLTGV